MARPKQPQPELGILGEFVGLMPPFIARSSVHHFTGGAIKPKTVQNDDEKGKGPRKAIYIAGKRCYPTPFFLEYLEGKGVSEIVVNPTI
ncbi:MAG: hypothetical protein JEY79_10935 [Pseudodesulfovibrio sp.]|nr:hypothetical protein [Pseudodesulfovibrio sp.]